MPVSTEQRLLQMLELVELGVRQEAAYAAEAEPLAHQLSDLSELFDCVFGVVQVPLLERATCAAELRCGVCDLNVYVFQDSVQAREAALQRLEHPLLDQVIGP